MPWTQYINLKGPQGEPGSDANVTSASIAGALGYTPESSSNKGQPNGYAGLDGNGRVPISQLPNSIMEYQGTYNASTNSPALTNGTGNTGDVYRVSVAGTRNFGAGNISFEVGDYVIYSGSEWQKSDTTDAVSTVAGLTGDVSGSSLRTAMSAITRSVQTITAPTTLGAAANTDYVYFLSNGTVTTTTNADPNDIVNVKLLLHGDGSNGATVFTDSSTFNRTMTRSGATISTTQSKFGGASMSFSGGQYVSVTSSDFAFGTGDFTVEAWIYLTTLNSYNHIMGTRQTSGNDANGFSMFVASGGEIAIYNDGFNVISAPGVVTTNSWQHYAISRSGNTVRIFKNGAQVASGAYSKTNSNTTFSIGGQVGDVSHPTTGFIDEVRVSSDAKYTAAFTPRTTPYYTAISTTEATVGTPTLPTAVGNTNQYTLKNITASPIIVSSTSSQTIDGAATGTSDSNFGSVIALLHGEGSNGSTTVVDSSSLASNWTLTNGSISTSQKKFGSSAISGRAVATAASSNFAYGTADFTIEFFVFLNANQGDLDLWDFRNGWAGGYQLYLNPGSQVLSLYTTSSVITGSTFVQPNVWHHVALTRSGTSTKLFLNGVQEGSTWTDTTNYPAHLPTIGGVHNSTTQFLVNGLYDEVRVTKAARYTSNFSVPTAAFPDSIGSGIAAGSLMRLISDGSNWRTV